MKKKDLISIIVPSFNEEESLPVFYSEINKISKEMSNVDFELLFVNDGSSDGTLNILRDLAKKDDRVRFISFSRNFGKEAAMLAGLSNSTGDYVAIMDADMQDPPELLVKMYSELKNEDLDCVALCSPKHNDYSKLRNFFTKLWYKLIDKLFDIPQVPGARDFRLMSKLMKDSILEFKEYNRYLKGIYGYVGFKTKWIEYETPERIAGNSKFSFIKLFKYALDGILSFSVKPLVLPIFVGGILTFTSLIALIVTLLRTIIKRVSFFTLGNIMWLILLIGGLQIFFIGIIALYFSKLYFEVKKRPIYIISETEKDLK